MGDAGAYSVGMVQFDAGHAITRHLLEHDHHRIGFLGAQLDPRMMERRAGNRAALQFSLVVR